MEATLTAPQVLQESKVEKNFRTESLSIFYGTYEAVKGISLPFPRSRLRR